MNDKELIVQWKTRRDINAYRQLKKKNTGMVMGAVNKYSAASVPRAALVGEAWKQFDDAVESYEPNRGAAFSTHLNYQLRKLDRYTKKYQNVARIPENISSRIGQYERVKGDLLSQTGKQPAPKDIAKAMKWTTTGVKSIENYRRKDLFEGGFEEIGGVDIARTHQDANIILLEIREELNFQEQQIFDYLIGHNKPKITDKKKLAVKLGMSTGRLSQITSGIARKVKPLLARAHGMGIHMEIGE